MRRPNPKPLWKVFQEEEAKGNEAMTITCISTPEELIIPVEGVTDHGLELVHELGGAPRNWLHIVSFASGNNAATVYVSEARYTYSHGFIGLDNGQKLVYGKQYPLSVAKW